MKELRKHPKAICEDCDLLARPYIEWYGTGSLKWLDRPAQYPILFIAQAPGDNEQYTGIPLTGDAGKQHYSLCRMAGISKPNVAHDNIISCYPGRDKNNNDLPPTQEQVKCCLPRLRWVIQQISPKLIYALGDHAMNVLTDLKGIQANRGRLVPLLDHFEYTCLVKCCLHPSFVMRSRQWIPMAVQTYQEGLSYVLGTTPPKSDEPDFLLDPSADELLAYLDTDQIVSWDTETTGLDSKRDTILGFSFCKDDNTAAAIYFKGESDPRWEVIRDVYQSDKYKKCWQNGSFDTSFGLATRMVSAGFAYDTRLAEQLIHSDLPTNLDFLRAQYTKIPPYKPSKAEYKQTASWGAEKTLNLAAWDAYTTFKVMKAQESYLTKKQIVLLDNLLYPLVTTINKMEQLGVLVDMDVLASLYVQIQPEMEKLGKIFWDQGINPNSPVQLKKFFNLKTTGEDHLEYHIKRNHNQTDLMRILLEYRGLHKSASVYLKGIYNRLFEGRIHTHFKIEGTGTGRLASEDPNLQNVPPLMRAIYIPDPGYFFISADYTQIELWVGAIIAEEAKMLEDLINGIDIHGLIAEACYERKKEDLSHDEVLRAKAVVFGTFFGRTARSIGIEFGVSDATARYWQNICIDRYPNIGNYKDRCESDIKRRGFLESPFGRTRWVQRATQGYNFPIQSTANDIQLGSLVLSDQVGLTPVLSVHDEIVYLVAKTDYEAEIEKIKEVMYRKVPELHNYQFPFKIKQGEDWYDMKQVYPVKEKTNGPNT